MNCFCPLLVFAASTTLLVTDLISILATQDLSWFSGCPELFKLSIISGLLVDESKDYVFKYFPPLLPFCPLLVSKNYIVNVLCALPVSNELSLV